MGASRKRFDATFKREAIRLADSSGKRDRQIERELGLYQGAVRHWRELVMSFLWIKRNMWDGFTKVSGEVDGKQVEGTAFVKLTGYK